MPAFDADKILQLARDNHEKYINADPFPHIYFDNFAVPEKIQAALDAFPKPKDLEFYEYNNPLEKKLAFDRVASMPEAIANVLHEMNQPVFLRFLEELTGIEGLISDPYYRGGGIHQIERGGKLDVHIDFNRYEKLGLERRLNVLLYLNQNWKEEYGGYFELWSGKKTGENQHEIGECKQRILPLFNRLAIFSTSEKSYHGHPEELNCPEGWSRKSLATYYYTADRPADEKAPPHSTIFIKRPQDPDDAEVAELRQKRNKGRLSSNINSDLVADK